MNLTELKSAYFYGVYQTQAFLIKEEPFVLQSGKSSHLYLNHRHFLSNNKYLALIAHIYHELIKPIEYDFQLGVVDSIASPLIVGAMCALFKKDYVVIKREPLKHGTQEYIYGKLNSPVILIDDMTSTGDTLIDAAMKIREKGGTVQYAVISAYRDETAIFNLQQQNIKLFSIASFATILNHLYPSLSEKEKVLVQSELQ